VPDEYWSKDQGYLKLRLKVELTNLVFGLARGDELETKGDPQAQQAADLFPRIPQILMATSPVPAWLGAFRKRSQPTKAPCGQNGLGTSLGSHRTSSASAKIPD
jgi:hypothetical protein